MTGRLIESCETAPVLAPVLVAAVEHVRVTEHALDPVLAPVPMNGPAPVLAHHVHHPILTHEMNAFLLPFYHLPQAPSPLNAMVISD